MPKRTILANPDEPRTGDYAFGLYDKLHPVHGQSEDINRARRELRGMSGERVTMTVVGSHITEEGKEKRLTIRRTFVLETYRDAFGPGSAFASAVHYIRNKFSSDTLIIHKIEVEEAEPGAEDDEEE